MFGGTAFLTALAASRCARCTGNGRLRQDNVRPGEHQTANKGQCRFHEMSVTPLLNELEHFFKRSNRLSDTFDHFLGSFLGSLFVALSEGLALSAASYSKVSADAGCF